MKRQAATKEQFLSQLRHHLRHLPAEEADSALSYYQEYFDDAGEEGLAETLRTLGSPREIAAELRANRTQQELESGPPSPKKGLSAVWVVILGIFAAPIALPLAIAAACLVIAAFIVFFSLIVSGLAVIFSIIATVGALTVGLILGGIFFICLSLPLFLEHMLTGVFFLGSGLAAAGIGLLILPCLLGLAKVSARGISHFFSRTLPGLITGLRRPRHRRRFH